MTVADQRDQLIALLALPELDVPAYWASASVMERVGTLLAEGGARAHEAHWDTRGHRLRR